MTGSFTYLAELCHPHDIPVELVQLVHPSCDSSRGKALSVTCKYHQHGLVGILAVDLISQSGLLSAIGM